MKRILTTFLSMIFCFALYAQAPEGYYDDAEGKTGETLKAALNNIISGHTELSYSECWDALEVTDVDPNNSNNVLGIYSRFSMNGPAHYDNGSGWNREHVWPQSRGNFDTSRGPGTDIHSLRACDISTNSARGNKIFDNGGTTYVDASGVYSGTTPAKRDSDSWEPGDDQKGDVARMIFYMSTRYEGENGEPDLELSDDVSGDEMMGKVSVLLAWHEADPVDQEEMNRHEGIYSFQGNRNPFIDHPEWVDDIWGDGSSVTASIEVSTDSGFDFGEVAAGESSSSESYTVSGTDLEGDIFVTISAPFELSLNNSTWAQSQTISQSTAEGSGQTVYVRFSPINQNGESFNQNITHTSSNAETVNISVSGSESTDVEAPQITTSLSAIDFGILEFGESMTESYTLSAVNLTEDLTVTPPDEVNIALESDFSGVVYSSSNPLVLNNSEGTVGQTTVYVRYEPSADDGSSFEEEILHESSGATKTIRVSGAEYDEPVLPVGWINEFHYANGGSDQNEFIEIYLENPSNFNLSDFTVELVDDDESVYSSFLASSMQEGAAGYYFRNFGGIKDGPNGFRLLYQNEEVHAISYGGAIADYELLAVEEGESTSSETSIQLCCGSTNYSDMVWTEGNLSTPGQPNESITLGLSDGRIFVYPNPTDGPLKIEGISGDLKVTLNDLKGRRLIEENGSKEKMELILAQTFTNLSPGTYVLVIEQDDIDISVNISVKN
ncbi:endonuclease [Ekhidna sp.]